MPIRQIGKIARDHNILFMLDTAQTAGILPIDVEKDGIDLLCFTGHKGLLGLQGTGGIYVRPGLELRTVKEGGTGSLSEYLEHPLFMPDHLEAGTLNTPGIAGLNAGVKYLLDQGLAGILRHERELTDRLLAGLQEISGVRLYGPKDSNKQTAVVAFNIDNMDCGDLSMRLDYEYGIITRAGLHCTPLAHSTIGTLEKGACRLSPGLFNSIGQIDFIIKSVYAISRTI